MLPPFRPAEFKKIRICSIWCDLANSFGRHRLFANPPVGDKEQTSCQLKLRGA